MSGRRGIADCLESGIVRRDADAPADALAGADALPLDSFHARQMVIAWWDDNIGGKNYPSANRVTRELKTLFGDADLRTQVARRTGKSGRVNAHVWQGYALVGAGDAPASDGNS